MYVFCYRLYLQDNWVIQNTHPAIAKIRHEFPSPTPKNYNEIKCESQRSTTFQRKVDTIRKENRGVIGYWQYLQDKIEERVDSTDFIFRFSFVNVPFPSDTGSDGEHQEDPQEDGNESGRHVVDDGPVAEFARHLGVEGRQAADETGHDQGDDHHLQHTQE